MSTHAIKRRSQRQLTDGSLYRRHRFQPDIISHAIWLYHRFPLSFRDVEDLLVGRGVTVSYETIRFWCRKFGLEYARTPRRRQGRLGDIWARGRAVRHDPRRAALSLESRGPGWRRTRYSGHTPARQASCQTLLPQGLETPRQATYAARHRQIAELSCSSPRF